MKSEEYSERVPRKVRGTLTIKAGDDLEFRAYRDTGQSSQEQVAKSGDSKLYRTVGEKKNSMVAHIVVPAGSSDPKADIYEQVEKLTKSLSDTKKKIPALKGRSLMRDSEVQVTTNQKERQVQVVLTIDVSQYPDYTSRLLTLMQRVNQCFATNQNSLMQLRK